MDSQVPNKRIIFIGGWTRDASSYKKLFKSVPPEVSIEFLPCYEIIHRFGLTGAAKGIKTSIHKNGSDHLTIMGHSLGGALAIEYALKYPKDVIDLILIDSSGLVYSQPITGKIANAVRAQMQFWRFKINENFYTFFRIMQHPMKNWSSLRYAYSCDLKDKLTDLIPRTHIIWGEKDHIYPPELAQRMNQLIKNSTLEIIPGADHDWLIHSPAKLWKRIR